MHVVEQRQIVAHIPPEPVVIDQRSTSVKDWLLVVDLRENVLFFGVFPMFVPSLSWQMFDF